MPPVAQMKHTSRGSFQTVRMMNEMGPKTTELVELMTELDELLARFGRDHWSKWVREDMARIKNSDSAGVQHFLSAFGGMGSLNDVYLCPANCDRIKEDQVEKVNGDLSSLLSRCWELATAIAHETEN